MPLQLRRWLPICSRLLCLRAAATIISRAKTVLPGQPLQRWWHAGSADGNTQWTIQRHESWWALLR
ncbi:MAG: hypothetical protein DWI23_03165 [Planctomycetota bacterium]|nr:MAG: hypothetical protein DWI23_03165 [Planctomycetota bacterium]